MKKSHPKSMYKGLAYQDAHFTGILTTDIGDKENVLLIKRPTFHDLRFLERAKAIVCTEILSSKSHEILIVKDMRIPLIHGVGPHIESQIGKTITFCSSNGIGVISTDKYKVKIAPQRNINKECALTSSIRGMQYYLSVNTKIIATRGEFILLPILNVHPLEMLKTKEGEQKINKQIVKVIGYAASHFKSVIYRLSDFSTYHLAHLNNFDDYEESELNPMLGNRGLHRLFNKHKPLLDCELMAVRKLSKLYNNISILIPYVRSISEAREAYKYIRSVLSHDVKIGCMIEVPSLLFFGKELSRLFDFFVIGTKDLAQLLYGSDRDSVLFNKIDEHLISVLLANYFCPSIAHSKILFVTSNLVYSELIKTQQNRKIYLLND